MQTKQYRQLSTQYILDKILNKIKLFGPPPHPTRTVGPHAAA